MVNQVKKIFIKTFGVLLLMAQTAEHGCIKEAVRMVQFPPDLLNDPNFTQLRFWVKISYAKKTVNFIKIKFATNCRYFKIIQ